MVDDEEMIVDEGVPTENISPNRFEKPSSKLPAFTEDGNPVEVLQITRQVLQNFIAGYCEMLEVDHNYQLMKAVQVLRADPNVADVPLKIMFKDKYPIIIQDLATIDNILTKAKVAYDRLKQSDIDEHNISNPFYKEYKEIYSEFSLKYSFLLVKCFYVLLASVNIRDQMIPSNAFIACRQKYRRFKIDERASRTIGDKIMAKRGDERTRESLLEE